MEDLYLLIRNGSCSRKHVTLCFSFAASDPSEQFRSCDIFVPEAQLRHSGHMITMHNTFYETPSCA